MRARVLRDPIYGYIHLPPELTPVVNHPLYQRLRRVVQTSLTSSVYPAATGSRFEHGLGAMFLAMRGWTAAFGNAEGGESTRTTFEAAVRDSEYQLPTKRPDLVETVRVAVGGAALLHDLGHPPFSHVLEPLYEEMAAEQLPDDVRKRLRKSGLAFHEFAGLELSREIVKEAPPQLAPLILAILEADPSDTSWLGALHGIIAGEVDVDRLDYLMRDAQKAGTEFGAIDWARLVDALELHETDGGFKIGPGIRARSAVETLLLQRTQAYKWISFHTRVVGANLALSRAVEILRDLAGRTDVIDTGPRMRSAELFRVAWPMLNYIAPQAADARRLLAPLLGAADDPPESQTSLTDNATESLIEPLRIELQANVDDSTVIEALKKGSIVARGLMSLKATTMDEGYRHELERYLTYAQHALHRRRNAVAAWKTVEEFNNVSAKLCDNLVEAVTIAYTEAAADSAYENRAKTIHAIESERDDIVKCLEEDPVVGANRLITLLFDDEPTRLDDLARALNNARSSLDDRPGFWDVAYTGFTAVKHEDDAATLFDGDDEVVLYESSALAQALQRVEASRYRLCALFFLTYPGTLATAGPGESREMRTRLAGEFLSVLPQYVQSALPSVIRESYTSPEHEGSTEGE
jgi:HD superfamily phosphohydrolase